MGRTKKETVDVVIKLGKHFGRSSQNMGRSSGFSSTLSKEGRDARINSENEEPIPVSLLSTKKTEKILSSLSGIIKDLQGLYSNVNKLVILTKY